MIAYLLIIFGFLMRLVPHMPNFAPIVAIALFSGAYLNKKMMLWVPLAIMVISDMVIGLHDMVLFTWGAFILIAFLGEWLKGRVNVKNLFGAGILSALIFFFISNLGVWLVWYPLTLRGFTTCFIKAIPFFRNTFISNMVFTFVLFGVYEAAKKFAEETRFKKVLLADI